MPQRQFYRKRYSGRLIKWIIGLFIIIALLILIALLGVFVVFSRDLPDPSSIEDRAITQSTKIYDRTGKIILYDIHGEERRTIIPFAEIPQAVKDAAIVAEDKDFYKHRGVDLKAVLRAAWIDLRGNSLQGGSTITQQFIKNSMLSAEKTFARKIKEAILALELERKYSKDEILNFYLNQISYGSNAYGIEAAAQTFFSKKATNLTLAEAVLLASLPQAPSYYSPYGLHLDELIARQQNILKKMHELNYISRDQYESAKKQKLNFAKSRSSIQAPHFVFYVRDLLEQKYGEDYINQAGLKIITTLDWDLQQIAQDVIEEGANNNESMGAYNAALVSIDPKTGQVLAMVGSRDYFKDPLPAGCDPGSSCKFEGNVNVALRLRQPGSAFKPFVYATAFKKGYTDKTILFDVPTQFDLGCNASGVPQESGAKCYAPKNFDLQFRGPVSARFALSNSLNVPAVQMLYLAGVSDSIDTAENMGISTLQDRNRFGLSLVLGGGEVKLLEMTSAFGVFATDGVRHPIAAILRIEDGKGEVLEEFKDEPRQVLDAEVTRTISSILSDNASRAAIFGPRSPLYFENRPVAAKTGTTNEYKDGWTIGYTPSLVVGVWAGNNDNTSTGREPGIYIAAPIWRKFLLGAFEKLNLKSENFMSPSEKVSSKPILNGEYIINGEIHSTLYYVNKDNPQGPAPINLLPDPMLSHWESAVRSWYGNALPTQTQNSTVPASTP